MAKAPRPGRPRPGCRHPPTTARPRAQSTPRLLTLSLSWSVACGYEDLGAHDASAPRRRSPTGRQHRRHGRSPAGSSPAAAREGPQMYGTGEAPAGRGPRRLHLRHRARDGGDGARGLRRGPPVGQRGCRRDAAGRARTGGRPRHGRRRLRGHDRRRGACPGARGGDRRERGPPPLRLPARAGGPAGRSLPRRRAQRARGDGVRGPYRRPRGPERRARPCWRSPWVS